jgi:hypothetical protein
MWGGWGIADPDWTATAKAGNGCGTHSTFSFTKPMPPTVPTVKVDVTACNGNVFPGLNCASDQDVVYTI